MTGTFRLLYKTGELNRDGVFICVLVFGNSFLLGVLLSIPSLSLITPVPWGTKLIPILIPFLALFTLLLGILDDVLVMLRLRRCVLAGDLELVLELIVDDLLSLSLLLLRLVLSGV